MAIQFIDEEALALAIGGEGGEGQYGGGMDAPSAGDSWGGDTFSGWSGDPTVSDFGNTYDPAVRDGIWGSSVLPDEAPIDSPLTAQMLADPFRAEVSTQTVQFDDGSRVSTMTDLRGDVLATVTLSAPTTQTFDDGSTMTSITMETRDHTGITTETFAGSTPSTDGGPANDGGQR